MLFVRSLVDVYVGNVYVTLAIEVVHVTLASQSGVIEELQFLSGFVIYVFPSVIEQNPPGCVNLTFLRNNSLNESQDL